MFSASLYRRYLFILILSLSTAAQANDYQKIFKNDYQRAVQISLNLRPLLSQYAELGKEDGKLIESIVFPELMRYNKFYDVVEVGSLMSLYSRFGSDYADFSIGNFQMKPSFASAIEQQFKNKQLHYFAKKLGFDQIDTADTYSNRLARIERLEDPVWQIKYFIGMLKCIAIKHHAYLQSSTKKERFIFIATAYNSGWNNSTSYIRSYQQKKFYQLSNLSSRQKYNFADIAWYRYQQN